MYNDESVILSITEKSAIEEWVNQNKKLFSYYLLKVRIGETGIGGTDEEQALNWKIYKSMMEISKARYLLFGSMQNINDSKKRNSEIARRLRPMIQYMEARYNKYIKQDIEEIAPHANRVVLGSDEAPVLAVYNLLKGVVDEIEFAKRGLAFTEKNAKTTYAIIEMLESSGIISIEAAEIAKWELAITNRDIEKEILDNNYNTHIDINELIVDRKKANKPHDIANTGMMMIARWDKSSLIYNYGLYSERTRIEKLIGTITDFSTLSEADYQELKSESESMDEQTDTSSNEVFGIIYAISDTIRNGKLDEKVQIPKVKEKVIEL